MLSKNLSINPQILESYTPGIKFTASAPGKVILHGEHSVVFNKLAITASLDLRTKLVLEEILKLDDNIAIQLNFLDINLKWSLNLTDLNTLLKNPIPVKSSLINLETPDNIDHEKHLENIKEFLSNGDKFHYLTDVQRKSITTFLYIFVGIFSISNIPLIPLRITLNSLLTLGAGTGSSASFSVCIVASLMHYLKLRSDREKLTELSKLITESSDESFSEELLQLISHWAFLGEKINHGNPSGVDNSICTFGSMITFKNRALCSKYKMRHPLRVLLINSLVNRDTKYLINKVQSTKNDFPQIVDSIFENIDMVASSALQYLVKLNLECSTENDIGEIYDKLSDLARINHGLLYSIGVSHPALEEIMSILKNFGLQGKLTGSGGGGYAFSYIPPRLNDSEISKVIDALKLKGYEAAMTNLAGDGVRVDQ